MKEFTEQLNQENSADTISTDTIAFYMQKSQQQRNACIVSAFTGLNSRIRCFFRTL